MESVLVEDEYSTITFAKLLYYCPPDKSKDSPFLCFVKHAIENEDGALDSDKINELKELLCRVQPDYSLENILVCLQLLQMDCSLNPECSCAVSNLLNLAILKCNFKNDAILNDICAKTCDVSYAISVFPEYSDRYEELMRRYNGKDKELLKYAYNKYRELPELLRKRIEEYDFQICLSYELFGDALDLRKLGTTHISGRKIRVWLEQGKLAIDMSLFHEIGHVIDYVVGEGQLHSKKDSAWQMVFNHDKDRYLRSKLHKEPELRMLHEYSVQNPTEYFASTFVDFIRNSDWLKTESPDTYYYMESLLQHS